MFKSKPKFDINKLKTALKMAQIRMRLQKQKKQNANSNARRMIATELQNQKEESARIKTELLIKDEYAVEAYEILELILEETTNKVNLIHQSKTVPDELDQLLSTIVYAAPRVPVKEMMDVREQLLLKFGKPFIDKSMDNMGDCVNPRVVSKLSIVTPSSVLVVQYMTEIAQFFNVDWHSSAIDDTVPFPSIASGPMAGGPYPPPPPQQPQQGGYYPTLSTLNPTIPTGPRSPSPPPSGGGFPAFPAVPGGAPRSPSPPPSGGGGFPAFPAVPSQGTNANSGFPAFPAVPGGAPHTSTPPPPSSGGFPAFPAVPSQGTNGGNEFPAFPAVPGNGTPSNAQPQNDFPAFPSVPGATGNSGGNDFPAFPSVPGATGSGSAATGSGGDLPGFDELNSRFEALKKKK